LKSFLTAEEGGRSKPQESDLKKAEVLNPSLIDYANGEHAVLDSWTPPSGIETDQIAGWGYDTLAGIDFYTPWLSSERFYKPILTEDGDGTVTVPSALLMASSTEVKRYWVDLGSINNIPGTKTKYSHKDFLEVPALEDFIKNRITNTNFALPQYVVSAQPQSTSVKKLIFILHSPLTLQLTDASGNVTGLAPGEVVSEEIPGSSYRELGEVKYVVVPEGGHYELTLHGQDSGEFTLDIEENVGGVAIASSSIAEVPTTARTLASLTLSGGLDTASALTVDETGDGTNVFSLSPKMGETVTYEPPPPQPLPAPVSQPSSASSAGAISIPALATTTVAAIPIGVATTTVTASVQIKIAPISRRVSPAVAPLKRVVTSLPQTVSTSSPPLAANNTASQQSGLMKLGAAVYNGWHGLWSVLKSFF